MTIFLLPTQAPRKYRGKYPRRIHSVGYSNSPSQKALCKFLGINRAVHLELRNGWRYIADTSDLHGDLPPVGAEFSTLIKPAIPIKPLPQDQYDKMLDLVRQARNS